MKGLCISFLMMISYLVQAQPSGRGMMSSQSAGNSDPSRSGEPGLGKISGIVMDSTSDKPVEFATVSLMDINSKNPVDGAICDDKGRFTINKIALGKYQLVVSFIGYKSKSFKNITLSGSRNSINLGTIIISPTMQELKAVTIMGQKPLIEEKVDRTIYNAENDATTKGGDATDVLRRVPMLSVDLDGNVSLRGSDNVKVLINNKPSTITASSVADALKQIPAEEIKNVEVITSPSAKYDAEGTAGIININTKKNDLKGFTMDVRGSGGLRGSNLGLNVGYRFKKIGFSLGGWGRNNYNVFGAFQNAQNTTNQGGSQSLNLQNANTKNFGHFGNLHFGIDYDINKKNSISLTGRVGDRAFNNFQDHLLTDTYFNDSLTSTNLRNVNTLNKSGNIDLTATYTHDFSKPQQELSLMAMFSRNNLMNNYINNILNEPDYTILDRLRNDNQSFNQEATLQLDYQTPIGNNQLLEFGGKDISRKVNSAYQYYTATGPDGVYIPSENLTLSNNFNYLQNITAGYLSYTLTVFKNYSIMAGTRYEYTTIRAYFQNESNINIPSYGILVPSINLSRKFGMGGALKFAYNRRIQRPSINFLNPNINAANPLNISYGNPDLGPEYTNNYELSYSAYFKGTSFNISTFMRNTNDAIQQISNVQGTDTIYTTFQNIGHETAYGTDLFLNVNLTNKLSLNGGTDIYYAVLNNNNANPIYNSKNRGWVAGYRLFGNYEIANGWALQFFGFYHGRRVQLQGYQGGFGIYSLSLQKEFLNKRASIGVGAENFLSPAFKIHNEVQSYDIDQHSLTTFHNMNFKINFSYRIGKLSMGSGSAHQKKSISNDDLMSGEENGNPIGAEDQQQIQNGQRQGRQGSFRNNRSKTDQSHTRKSKDSKDSKKKKKDSSGTGTDQQK